MDRTGSFRRRACQKLFSFLLFTILAFGICLGTACDNENSKETSEQEDSDFPVFKEEVTVKLPGMQGEKRFLYLSDLHLITMSDQVAADQKETVEGRMAWSSYEGVTAEQAWPTWITYLNDQKADAVLFGADMIDFASRSNVDALKEGLSNLKHDYLYVRADHDLAPSYLNGVFEPESIGYQREIEPYDTVMMLEFDEFFIAGWNNSTAQMTPAGLQKMKILNERAKKEGKAIILLTHVPIKPLGEGEEMPSPLGASEPLAGVVKNEKSLSEASEEAWSGRALIWGAGCSYAPDDITSEFLRMIYADDTPFVEILCGHLHFSWDGYVTEKVHQHVFGAAIEHNIGVITVTGE